MTRFHQPGKKVKLMRSTRSAVSMLAAAGMLGLMLSGANPGSAQKATSKVPQKSQTRKATKAQYECAHCGIMMTKVGKCPKCGMAMTKVAAGKANKARYECRMCGVMSVKAGKCPKCGMAMTKMARPKKG